MAVITSFTKLSIYTTDLPQQVLQLNFEEKEEMPLIYLNVNGLFLIEWTISAAHIYMTDCRLFGVVPQFHTLYCTARDQQTMYSKI